MDTLKKKVVVNTLFLILQTKTKKLLSKYTEFWDGVKNFIGKIDDKLDKYGKDFLKIII